MAKLPKRRQNQRLDPGQATQLVNPRAARAGGEAISALANQVGNFAQASANYNKVKSAADDNVVDKDFAMKAELTSVRAMDTATNSPLLSEDGSNLEALYANQFEPLLEEANEIPDKGRRQLAQNRIQAAMTTGTIAAIKRGRILHNQFNFNKSEEITAGSAQIAFADPFKSAEQIELLEDYYENGPFDIPTRKKLLDEGKKEIAVGALAGLLDQGNHRGAVEALTEGAFPFIKSAERSKMIDAIKSKQKTFVKDRFEKQEKDRQHINRQVELQKANVLSEVLSATALNDPGNIDLARKKTRGLVGEGLVNKVFLDALDVSDEDVPDALSVRTYEAYENRLSSKRGLKTFLLDIAKSVVDKSIEPSLAGDLVSQYNKSSIPKTGTDASAKKTASGRAAGMAILNNAMRSGKLSRGRLEADKAKKGSILKWYSKFGGDSPEAMIKAIKLVDPTNSIFNEPDPIPKDFDKRVKSAQKAGDKDEFERLLKIALDHKDNKNVQRFLKTQKGGS